MEFPIITFSTAWYDLDSKFSKKQYYIWAQNLLKNVRKFNLIVYVEDYKSQQLIEILSDKNPKVYIIIIPFNELPLYKKYALLFEKNHIYNIELNKRVSWKLILLWCSKQFFVETTEYKIINKKFNYPKEKTKYYGWMDIGYFRSRNKEYSELLPEQIQQFPNKNKIEILETNKIHYGLVNPQITEILKQYVYNRNELDLPEIPIPMNQVSIAGGFFILSGNGIAKEWREQFEIHLYKYFKGGYVIKDDQYLIIDLILLNPNKFKLWVEPLYENVDNWFLFQRLLN